MSVITNTGITLSVVAGAPATLDKLGYEALTFVEVGEVTDLGEYGPNVEVVTHNPLKTGVTQKLPGFINYGSQTIALGWDVADEGQTLLSDAANNPATAGEHSVKVQYADGSIDYYVGRVFSYTKAPGSANSVVGSNVNFELNTPVLNVPAP